MLAVRATWATSERSFAVLVENQMSTRRTRAARQVDGRGFRRAMLTQGTRGSDMSALLTV